MLIGFSTAAQNKKVTFTGAGRLLMSSDRIHGDLLDSVLVGGVYVAGDTVTAQRELGGYALFDLGFDIRPNSQTEIKAVTRVTSDLDGFWGAGIAFQVRELYARGLIQNMIRYKIGDIDTKATPYTLWNSERDLGIGHSAALGLFGDIIDYENFYQDNMWRQQGAELDFSLSTPVLFDEVDIRGLISKNRNTDYFSLPDRLFTLGSIEARNQKFGTVRYTYTRMFEVPSSAQFSESFGTSDVHSLGFESIEKGEWKMAVEAEAGRSGTWYRETAGAPADTSGFFYDLGIKASVPGSAWKVKLAYRMVESGFRSPGAQSRRLVVGRTPAAFSFTSNQEVARAIGIGDVLKDPSLYALSFSPELAVYDPALENVEPYGAATPNRQGVTLKVGMEQDSSIIRSFSFDGGFLSEVSGRGIAEMRNFSYVRLRTGIQQGPLSATAAIQFQKTKRAGLSGLGEGLDGIGEVELTSTFAEIGFAWEIAKKTDIVAAFLFFAADGNEYTAVRDGFNTITDYRETQFDRSENMTAVGLRYRFNNQTHLTIQQHLRGYSDVYNADNDYRMNQFVVLYSMFF